MGACTVRLRHTLFALFLSAIPTTGCDTKPASGESASSPPAKVLREAGLNTIVLTEEAERRLGIETAPVERRELSGFRVVGGEALVPPGLAISVSAPVPGTIHPSTSGTDAGDGETPAAGRRVKRGQVIFLLAPTLPAEAMISLATSRLDAVSAVKAATVEVDAAKTAFERARRLVEEKTGSQRDLDVASARLALAREALRAAEARRQLLDGLEVGGMRNQSTSLRLVSPLDGVLTEIHVGPGQVVAAGASLFAVEAVDPLWIRVPVYAGDADDVDPVRSVRLARLAETDRRPERTARPVAGPPSADPAAATIDLFYEVDNSDGALRPGEKLRVTLPGRTREPSTVIPYSAVVHDVQGGTWVYESTAPRTYVRRRVAVREVRETLAILASGPAPDATVVVAGAAELFGTEFGIGK